MPSPAGPLVDTILQRVYDPLGAATTRPQVFDLLSRCQQIVNAAFDSVVVNLAFNTGPRQQVFTLSEIAPADDVLKVLSVRDKHRDLSEVPFNRLKHISARWFGQSGPRWETFAKLGKTMIVVHPMKQSADSLTLVYTQALPPLLGDADICPLPNDQIPTLTKLVETLLLLRQRNFEGIKMIVQSLIAEAQATKLAEDGKDAPMA